MSVVPCAVFISQGTAARHRLGFLCGRFISCCHLHLTIFHGKGKELLFMYQENESFFAKKKRSVTRLWTLLGEMVAWGRENERRHGAYEMGHEWPDARQRPLSYDSPLTG